MKNKGFTRTTKSRSSDRGSSRVSNTQSNIAPYVRSWDGFTFVELILYIALISVFLGGIVQFYRYIAILRVRSLVGREITYSVQYAGKRIAYEIRSASDMNSITSTSLCLASSDPSRNPTLLYVSQNRLRIGWGGGSLDCTGLTNDYPVTSSLVNISGFNFQNLSNFSTKNIHYSFIVSYAANTNRKEWQKSETASGSAEIRAL